MIPPSQSETRFRRVLALALVGAACFLIGCMVNAAIAKLAGLAMPNLSEPVTFLLVLLPLLDTVVLMVFVGMSQVLGWRATRTFWITVVPATAAAWLIGDLVPALLPVYAAMWRVSLQWLGPLLVGVLCVAWLAVLRDWGSEFWTPVAALIRGGGTASVVVAVALPLRIGLAAYTLPHGVPRSAASETRLQHVAAPADYVDLQNPFQSPQYCVVLEQVRSDSDVLRDIVQNAVENRTTERAAILLSQTPSAICEVVAQKSADMIVEKLRAAGADCSVRDTLDVFIEQVMADTPTPIGRPSQVLDPEYLTTGRDSIAELRAAVSDSTAATAAVDRELAKRAYVAFTTAQGRALYQINCRACHGTKGSGDGPMAAGLALRPANFRDAQGIATLTPGEVLWRIEQGAAGLPPQATPWDSSMPAWKHELDRELVWKIILGEFDVANRKPAPSGASPHRHHQPRVATTGRALPENKSWLEWPVPPPPDGPHMNDAAFVKRGGYVYYYRCMPCHGVTGRGDGPAAYTMWPRPRDFTTENFAIETPQPKFKFRTTKQGWLPTDQDLYRTISRGLTGTAMEGWDGLLSPDEIWQVIAYIKTLSPAWNDPEHIARNPNDPVVVKEFAELDRSPPTIDYAAMLPPTVTPELAAEGDDTFLKARCYECHGVEARGDGLALGQHYDDWGYRMWPQNLARSFNYKAGHAIKDIYRTFANRLDGTVMPVYTAKTLDQQDPKHGEHLQWALASHVSGQVQTQAGPTATANVVIATRLTGNLPVDPLDPEWQRLPKTLVPLSGQVLVPPRWAAPSVSQVGVRVAVDAQAMAVWLQWDDRRPNITHRELPVEFSVSADPILGPATYAAPALKPKAPVTFEARDQLEIQFPSAAAVIPSTHNGFQRPPLLYGSDEVPATLWRWSADRQGLAIKKQVVEIAGAKTERLECTSEVTEGHHRALDLLTARGPAAEPEPVASTQNARARAEWSNGAWTLVMSGYSFVPEEFLKGMQPLPIAIHIWDGLAGEADLRMAISSWIDVVLPSARPIWHHGLALLLALAVAAAEWQLVRRYRY